MFQRRSPRSSHEHYERILDALGGAITSRRSFLLGVGTMPVVGYAARAARNFKIESDGVSAAVLVGGAPAWHIDTRWFDGNPKLYVRSLPDRLRIVLSRALFPGTDLPGDLEIDARRHGAGWDARFLLRGFRWQATGSFDRWLLGLQDVSAPFHLDSVRLRGRAAPAFEAVHGTAAFAPDWSYIARTLEAGTCSFTEADSLIAGFRLEIEHDGGDPPRTCIWADQTGLHDARCDESERRGGCSVRVQGTHSIFAAASRTGTDMIVQGREHDSRLVVHGRTALDVPAHDVELLHRFDEGMHSWRAKLSTDSGVWVPFEDGALQLTADDTLPVRVASAGGASPFDPRCAPETAAFVVPVAGADDAIFRRRRTAGDCPITQFSGHSIDLAPFDLHLRRRSDGLACVVRFRNVVLEHTLRGWSLKAAEGKPAQIEFDLGSQHIREEAVYFTDWCDGTQPPDVTHPVIPVPDEQAVERLRKWPVVQGLPQGIGALPANDTPYLKYLEVLKSPANLTGYEMFRRELAAEMHNPIPPTCSTGLTPPKFERAGATHLLFDFAEGKSIPLGLDALFGWGTSSSSPLKAVFSRRAAPEGTMSIGVLDMEISDPRSIADAPASGPPEGNGKLEFATRIEAPALLVVSPVPTRAAKPLWPTWSVSARPAQDGVDNDGASEVWNIRMTGVGLRAIYTTTLFPRGSTHADPVAFKPFDTPLPYPNSPDRDCFRASYDARDLHELVGLTGVYNYEALCGSPQVTCPKDADARKPVRGQYLSAPMKAELLLLSGLGASFRYRGAWSPPSTVNSSGALTVKRYLHNASLGRDTYVRFEYKGFLFPLGQPAILVKLTDRRFGLEAGNRWVARLVQRFFIYIPGFARTFPAVAQPHERMWGHAQTAMDAFTTPDLADPAGYDVIPGMGITAFWPCLPGGTRDKPNNVVFEYTDPLTKARYASPLIFVDNSVAHNVDKLADVIVYWRTKVKDALAAIPTTWPVSPSGPPPPRWPRTGAVARHFATVASAKLPYIAGQRGDNTELETSCVLLSVSLPGEPGYDDSVDKTAIQRKLAWSSDMEGRDQPPFYPVRRRAHVASTSAAVLSGQVRQEYLLEYDNVFLDAGLDSSRNAATIFGVFVGRGMDLNFGQDTSRSGAAFSPSATMMHTSVKRGLVGGTNADLRKLGSIRSLDVKIQGEPDKRPDDFDPKKYFAQMLGDAKLLGVVRLVDILEVLLVASGTKVPTIDRQDLYDILLPVLRAAADAVVSAATQVDDVLKSMDSDKDTPDQIAARRLEPLWADVLHASQKASDVVNQSAPADKAVAEAVSKLAAAFDKFKSELESIAADPTVLLSEDAKELIQRGRRLLEQLRQFVPPEQFAKAVLTQLEKMAVSHLRRRIDTILLSLGGNPEVTRITAALTSISETISRIEQGAQDARQLVEMLKPEVMQLLAETLQQAENELFFVASMASEACRRSELGVWAQAQIQEAAHAWNRFDEAVTRHVQAVAKAFEDAMRELADGASVPNDKLLRAQHTFVGILNGLNADAAALTAVGTQLTGLQVIELCDFKGEDKVLDAARALFAYLLSAPSRIARTAALLQQVDTDVRQLFDAVAVKWAKAEREAVAKCVAALENASAAALHAIVKDALDSARTIDSKLKDVSTSSDVRAALGILQEGAKDFEGLRVAVETISMLSPKVIEAAARRELQNAIADVMQKVAVLRTNLTDQVYSEALKVIPADVLTTLATTARDVSGKVRYLTPELKADLTNFASAAEGCLNVPLGKGAQRAEQFITSANAIYTLLGRAISSGDPSKLVDLRKIAEDLIAQLGVPTRVRIHYEWETEVHATPEGDGAIFEPDGDGTLKIVSTIEASLKGGAPSITLAAKLSPFWINLFGKADSSNFLTIGFNGLVVTTQPGQSIDCKTDLTSVVPGKALGFVQRLSAVFGGRSGFFVLPSLRGIVVGYEYSRPTENLGGFTIQNLSLLISVSLPFDNTPVLARFALASKEKPFLMSAGIYGGGGFVGIRTRADTLEILEASFEYGVVTAFAYGPVKGSGRVTAGIYISMGGRDPVIEGFFCAAGEATVASIISVSAMLRVSLSYHIDTGQTSGVADFTFKFSIGFFDYSYTCTVPYAKSGDSAGGGGQAALDGDEFQQRLLAFTKPDRQETSTATDAPPPWAALFGTDPRSESFIPKRGLLDPAAWVRYWRAFDPQLRPELRSWITSWQPHDAPRRGAPAAESFARDHAIWFVVPWGYETKGGTVLRASLRITLVGGDDAIVANWPSLIAGGGTIQLLANKDKDKPIEVDVGKAYRSQLDALGLSVKDAKELWKAVFSDKLPSAGKPIAARKGAHPDTFLTRSAEMQATASKFAGYIFATSIEGIARKGDRRIVPLTSLHANPLVAKALNTLGSIYVPAQAPRTVVPSPSARAEGSILAGWIGRTMFGQDSAEALTGNSPRARTHFSEDAIQELLSPGLSISSANKEDMPCQFRSLLLSRMAAYKSDPVNVKQRMKAANLPKVETFEDRVAGLVAHPWLLKALGLVIDVRVDVGMQSDTLCSVCVDSWGGQPCKPRQVTMVMDGLPDPVELTDPDVEPPPVDRGLVDLSVGMKRFELGQLDVDRTPQRILQTAVSFRNEFLAGVHPRDVSVSLQPQETVGISLHEYLKYEPPLKAQSDETDHVLYLRHLMLGMRPDVKRVSAQVDAAGAQSQEWTSLSARRVRRILINGRDVTDRFPGILGVVDEGFIGKRLRSTGGDAARDIPESEWFRWDIWPLGSRRPDANDAEEVELPKDFSEKRPGGSHLAIEYESLPGATAQRIGEGYRIGARAVMIDGNSISLDEADTRIDGAGLRMHSRGDDVDADHLSWLGFQRYETVQPPKVLMEGWPAKSEQLLPERSSRAVVHAAGRKVTKRVLVPPRCASIDLAIRHGVFDVMPETDAPPPGAFPGVLLLPTGDFPSFRFAYLGLPDRSGTHEAYFRRLGSAPAPMVPYYPDPWARRAILGFYRVGDDQLMWIDFHDYYEGRSWPDARELELVVEAVESVPEPRGFTVRKECGRVTVTLARGTHLTLRVWHEVTRNELDQSAVVDQIAQFAFNAEAAPLRAAICSNAANPAEARSDVLDWLSNWYTLRGDDKLLARPDGEVLKNLNLASFWMINPAHEIELLHASQQPRMPAYLSVATPVPKPQGTARAPAPVTAIESAVFVVREEAKTSVTFAGDVVLDRATTRNVDAQATWSDNATTPVKTPKGSTIRVEDRQGLLFQLRDIAPVARDRLGAAPEKPLDPELLPEQRLQALDGEVVASDRNENKKPNSGTYDFGDTRARALHVKLTSMSRDVGEFTGDPKAKANDYAVTSRAQRLVVPAACRPDAPDVQYVMPLYKWKNARADTGRQRRREAGWFRIWLGPQWYSSGNGELLALVCSPSWLLDPQDRAARLAIGPEPKRFVAPPKWLEPMVTRWGLDPLAEQEVVFGALPASALRNRILSYEGLKAMAPKVDAAFANDLHHLMDAATFEPQYDLSLLPDVPASGAVGNEDPKVVLALYRPLFDATTARWYADIQIDPQYAYQPFVRLALARWQPHALHDFRVDLRLSRVVSTEFVQLLPERSATLVPATTAKGRTLRVSLTGAFMGGKTSSRATSDVTFRLERIHPTRTGDTWIPIESRTPDLANGAFSEQMPLPHEFGAAYSIVIEERERFHDEARGSGRLVYFDRIAVPE
jgi:hypothetical protein